MKYDLPLYHVINYYYMFNAQTFVFVKQIVMNAQVILRKKRLRVLMYIKVSDASF